MVDQSEIHRKCISDKVEERIEAARQIRNNFANLPDENAAWQDLHRLTADENSSVRRGAAYTLGSAFFAVPGKDAAWQDLHRLTVDVDSSVRRSAAYALGSAFFAIPGKDAASQDIHRLTSDEDSSVRHEAAIALGVAFSAVPDRDAAWQDLHRLTSDENCYVRLGATHALTAAFSTVPDKNEAWQDLHRLTSDENSSVRLVAARALGAIFSAVPDKNAAWQDLHRLTYDKDSFVRREAAEGLGAAFSTVPDKNAAWQDLHRLTFDEDSFVLSGAARALGAAFSNISDKDGAWKAMVNLSGNDDRYVRMYGNHSLGRASIFKATVAEGEEDFRRELENALEYFEKSAAEAQYFNPAKFCLPFYRSFYVLTFKKEGSEAEVQKYLAEAKIASEGSKSKNDLLEAVENLSNALKETQSLRKIGFEAAKCDLNAYRRYCNRAAELLDESEERAPGATKLIKKTLPIVDHKITDLLENIKSKSENICKTGNPLEAELGCKIQKRATYALGKTCNPIRVQKEVNCMLSDFDLWSKSISDLYSRECIKAALEEAEREEEIDRQLSIIRCTLQVVIMSGKETPKYVIEGSTVQIAEGQGHDQEMNLSSNAKVEAPKNIRENGKNNQPWYKDRNYLIAVIGVLIAAITFWHQYYK